MIIEPEEYKRLKRLKIQNTKKLEQNAPSYEYYNYPMVINNTSYTIIMTVRIIKDGKDNRFIYYHYLDNVYIKKEPPSSIPRNPETE